MWALRRSRSLPANRHFQAFREVSSEHTSWITPLHLPLPSRHWYSSFAIHYSPFAVRSTQIKSSIVVTTVDDSTTQLHVSPSPMENSICLVKMPRSTYTIIFSTLNEHWFLLLCTHIFRHYLLDFLILNIIETILSLDISRNQMWMALCKHKFIG